MLAASFSNCIIVHSNWATFQTRRTALLIIFPSELKKKAQFLTKTERVRKRYGLVEFIYFLMIIYQKKMFIY